MTENSQKPDFRVDGMTATGADSGIGRAIAKRFASNCAKVFLLDVRRKLAVETAARMTRFEPGPEDVEGLQKSAHVSVVARAILSPSTAVTPKCEFRGES